MVSTINVSSQPGGALFTNYSVADGLKDKTIHCIFQDRKGWVWIGTDFGILRFDGYTFKDFLIDSEESEILSKSLIRTIIEDKNGVIWVGTELNGIFKYDRRYYKIEQIKDSLLTNNSVWTIVPDNKNKLWIGTEDGLCYFNPESKTSIKKITLETHPNLLTGSFIRKLMIDVNNRLWVGTNNGVTVLNDDLSLWNKFLNNAQIENELENEVWEIYQDNKDYVWIGTYLGGLYRYSIFENELQKFPLDEKNERAFTVRSIVQDKRNNLWVGTRGGLFSISKDNELNQYNNNHLDEYSLIHNSVLNLMLDAKGDLWIGTRNGISYLNFERKAFTYLNSLNSGNTIMNNSEVYALWEDAENNLWIGTESGGVNIYNKEKNSLRYLTTKDNLSNNCIKAISPDGEGNVLIGTYLGGLNLYNTQSGKNKIFIHEEDNEASLSDNSVWAIYTDSRNRIWIGTSAGVDIFDGKNEKFQHFGEKFEVGWVSLIFEDDQERIWLYSVDLKRLTMISPGGAVQHYPYQSRAITNSTNGKVWISTVGNGLIELDPSNGKSNDYTIANGLCSNVIYGMVKVDKEFLWLSTNNGLSCFDIVNKTFKNYYISNGLLNNQFNYGAAITYSKNYIVFGGKKGVDILNLKELHENEYIPPVVLTNIRIFNKPVAISPNKNNDAPLNNLISETKQITLHYDQNMITFDFAALNYANSEMNTYKYKLEGFDKEWNEIGNQHSATYTNLDYGEYIFKVIGTNSDNRFDPEGLVFHVTILPPFWKTWIFRGIIIGLIGLLFYSIYGFIVNREKLKQQLIFERKNARQIKELERLKHKFFMNVSHEIRTPLSLIIGPLDKLMKTEMSPEQQKAHFVIIRRNTIILNKLVSQLLDYRKLETGNLKLDLKQGNLNVFIENITDSFRHLAEDKGIELEYNIAHKSLFFAFDSDKLEKILNNLLSNAIKFTNSKGKVILSVSLTYLDELESTVNYIPTVNFENNTVNQFVKITVRDTGIGIPKVQVSRIFDRFRQIEGKKSQASGTGIGLSLTKELVKLHNGHIKAKSVEGIGSKFILLIPYIQLDDLNKSVTNLHDELGIEISTGDILSTQEGNVNHKHKPILLIVDDNHDIRTFVNHHFLPEYDVVEAVDGKEGWIKALELIPDIIITDIMMPHIDGVGLCKKIKNDECTSHIPVLMLTALTAKEKQIDGISAGAEDYIVKPFDVTVLKAKVDNILYIRKSLRERFSKEMLLKPRDIVLASPDEKFLRKVIQVIEKNISQPNLDVDFLAKNVGVSRTQLYRKLSALTDMAAKEFVKDIRLKRSAQLIPQNKLTISEIAYEVGFNDVSYFRKCFKEKYGVSASHYTKNKNDTQDF